MRFSSKRLIITLLVLAVACTGLFAEAIREKSNAQDYSTLDLEQASFEAVMKSFEASVEEYNYKYQDIYDNMVKAYRNSNASDYFDAKHMLANLTKPVVTAQDTEILVQKIVAETDADKQAEYAKWLSTNSKYYKPSIRFTGSLSDGRRSNSYSYSLSVTPGTTVTAPTVNLGKSTKVVFEGWGLTADEVLFKAGDEIPMPYESVTYYAVFTEKQEVSE